MRYQIFSILWSIFHIVVCYFSILACLLHLFKLLNKRCSVLNQSILVYKLLWSLIAHWSHLRSWSKFCRMSYSWMDTHPTKHSCCHWRRGWRGTWVAGHPKCRLRICCGSTKSECKRRLTWRWWWWWWRGKITKHIH